MKRLIVSIAILLILSACSTATAPTPGIPATTAIETLVPTSIPAPTFTPAPTKTPAPTETIAPTSTEVVAPLPALDTLITNLDGALLQEALAILNEQFVSGIEKEYNSYHFLAVGGEIITHENPIQLPGGYEISHTFALQYLDAAGNDQVVHIPIHVYNRDDGERQLLGHKIKKNGNSIIDHLGISSIDFEVEKLTDLDLSTIDFLQDAGWTETGHIFYVSFAVPDGDEFNQLSGQGFLNDVIRELYSEESLAEFARTGNPEVLVQIPGEDGYLLLPVHVDMKNFLGAVQTAIFDDWADPNR